MIPASVRWRELLAVLLRKEIYGTGDDRQYIV